MSLTWKQGASIYYQQAVEDRRYSVAKYAKDGGGWHYVAWMKEGAHLERLCAANNTSLDKARKAADEHFGAQRKAA